MNAIPNRNSVKPLRALLCTVPLDIGIPRDLSQLPVMPKIAIVSLINWMGRNGIERDEFDFYDIDMLDASDDEIRAYFREYQPTVFGFSATVSTTYLQVKRLARIAREECPDAWIIMGGSLAASAKVVLNKTDVEICIQGDGEIPWAQFLHYVKAHGREWNYEVLNEIKGLTYNTPEGEMYFSGYPQKIPASEIPYPDYDILSIGLKTRPEAINNYFRDGRGSGWFQPDPRTWEPHRRPKIAALWTTKGCVARCTFCQRSTKGYQTNSVTTLDEHLTILKERYNVGFIQIVDENFGSDTKHAREIAETLHKHDMLWICGGVRCTSVTDELVEFYHSRGCSGLKFGVESGSQKILDLMEKRFTVEHVYKAIDYCNRHNVYSPLAVMTGMPGENDETAKQTGVFLSTLCRKVGIPPEEMGNAIFYALPLSGTPLYEYGQQLGIIGTSVDDEEKYLEAISDIGAGKENYINLNGHSLRKILFWDYLIRYEATRHYYATPLGDDLVVTQLNAKREEGELPSDIHGVDHAKYHEAHKNFPAMGSMAYRVAHKMGKGFRLMFTKPFRTIANLMDYAIHWMMGIATATNDKLVAKRWVTKIPRPLIYIPMRNWLYAEFLLRAWHRKFRRWRGHYVAPRNLYNDFKFPKPLTDDYIGSFERQNDRSLRQVVKRMRDELPQPQTLTEQTHQILVQGR